LQHSLAMICRLYEAFLIGYKKQQIFTFLLKLLMLIFVLNLMAMSLPNNFFQEQLENDVAMLIPLADNDFEDLYAVANDPLIWEQHPNPNRYKRPDFETYFKGAIESCGAYKVIDKLTGEIAGSSRFYEYDEATSSVIIGYTFVARKYWGKGMNQAMKSLMMNHAFQQVDNVIFHVGAANRRSQIAMERLGGKKVKEIEVAYYGEPSKINFEYIIEKKDINKI
jgi:N-acetyltransferase